MTGEVTGLDDRRTGRGLHQKPMAWREPVPCRRPTDHDCLDVGDRSTERAGHRRPPHQLAAIDRRPSCGCAHDLSTQDRCCHSRQTDRRLSNRSERDNDQDDHRRRTEGPGQQHAEDRPPELDNANVAHRPLFHHRASCPSSAGHAMPQSQVTRSLVTFRAIRVTLRAIGMSPVLFIRGQRPGQARSEEMSLALSDTTEWSYGLLNGLFSQRRGYG